MDTLIQRLGNFVVRPDTSGGGLQSLALVQPGSGPRSVAPAPAVLPGSGSRGAIAAQALAKLGSGVELKSSDIWVI